MRGVFICFNPRLLTSFCSYSLGKLLVELVDTAISSDITLLTSVERVAVGASFDLDLLEDGSGFEGIAARDASHRALVVFRMDVFLHFIYSFRLVDITTKRVTGIMLDFPLLFRNIYL